MRNRHWQSPGPAPQKASHSTPADPNIPCRQRTVIYTRWHPNRSDGAPGPLATAAPSAEGSHGFEGRTPTPSPTAVAEAATAASARSAPTRWPDLALLHVPLKLLHLVDHLRLVAWWEG
jgi:hypothetical protein